MEERILQLIKTMSGEKSDIIGLDSSISDILDSISFIKSVVALEKEFDFEFDEDYLIISQFPTVKAVIEYVATKAGSAMKD
jgi:acyl carrier protein